jgi:hypothetical protein
MLYDGITISFTIYKSHRYHRSLENSSKPPQSIQSIDKHSIFLFGIHNLQLSIYKLPERIEENTLVIAVTI